MLDALTGAQTTDALSLSQMFTALAVSLVLGLLISLCWQHSGRNHDQRQSFSITLVMLPAILTVVILFVGSNVARAFSLAGTLSIIRFRSAPGEPRDIGYVFFALAAGLSCGIGLYVFGAVFTVLLCAVLLVLDRARFGADSSQPMSLKITVPEDLNYRAAFEEPLERFTARHTMKRVRTTELGSLFEVIYTVALKPDTDEKALIDELRCRNGNLSVVLTLEPTETGGV